MIRILSFMLIVLSFLGCKKEVANAIKSEFPYENENIKIEIAGDAVPEMISDIYFSSSENGFVVTRNGEIFRTSDGGKTWNLKYKNQVPDQPLFRIFFTDAKTAFIVGGSFSCGGKGCKPAGGIILKTTDGGENWTSIFQLPKVEFTSIAQNTAGELFVTANGPRISIFKSTDAGKNWLEILQATNRLHKIAFSENTGYCSGYGELLVSKDNGLSWNRNPDIINSTDIAMQDEIGFCIAEFGQKLFKTENGEEWQQNSSSGYRAFSIAPLTDKNCLVFGESAYIGNCSGYYSGLVKQTYDGGKTWQEKHFEEIPAIYHSSFYSPKNGFALARNTVLKITVKDRNKQNEPK